MSKLAFDIWVYLQKTLSLFITNIVVLITYLLHLTDIIFHMTASSQINLQNHLPQSPQQEEAGKVSYWLKKLFYQQEEKNEREKKEKIEKIQSELHTSTTDNTVINSLTQNRQVSKIEAQNIPTIREINIKNMERMVKSSNRVNISASSVFPWDLFPTTIQVEDTRITIIHRQLFSSQVHTVELKDISNVLLESGILFATIRIISRTFVENEITIGRLWKKDAQLVHKAIEGFRKFEKEKIDISHFSTEELINKLNEMSTA